MFPVLHIFGFAIPTYGLFAASGWIVAICIWMTQARHLNLKDGDRDLWRLVYVLLGGSLVGGKLLALIDYRRAGLDAMLAQLSSGFVYLGGLGGALLAAAIYCAMRGHSFFGDKADFLASGEALGHAIGRIGCLMAGCCHGAPTSLPWGLTFTDPDASLPRHLLGVPLHPTQLLEAGGELGIFLVLHFYFLRRRIAGTLAPGVTGMALLTLYGTLRFLVDFGRGDDPDFRIGPLTASQGMSLVMIAVALWYARRRTRTWQRVEPAIAG